MQVLNFGIAIFAFILISGNASEQYHRHSNKERYPYKEQSASICDAEKLLEPMAFLFCDSIIDIIENKHHTELVLATIPEGYTSAEAFDDYCLELAHEWNIGLHGKGMIIGISKYHRKMRIHNNQALSEVWSDAETKYIINQSFIPFFKKEAYATGILQGLIGIEASLSHL